MVKVKNPKGPNQINQKKMYTRVKGLQMCWLVYTTSFTTTLQIYYLLNKYLLSTIYVLCVGLTMSERGKITLLMEVLG